MKAKKKWTPERWQQVLDIVEHDADCQSLIHSKLKSVGSYSGPRKTRKGEYRFSGEYADVIDEIFFSLSELTPPLSDAEIIAIAKNAVKEYFRSGSGRDYAVKYEYEYEKYTVNETGGHYSSDTHKSEREENTYTPFSGTSNQQAELYWNSLSQFAALDEWCIENYETIENLLSQIIDDLWMLGKLGRSPHTPNILKYYFHNKNANQTEIAEFVGISQQAVSQKINDYMRVVSKAFLEHPEGKRSIRHRDQYLKYYDDEAAKFNVTPDYSYHVSTGKCSVSVPFDGERNNRLYIYWPQDGRTRNANGTERDVYNLDTYPKNRGRNCDRQSYGDLFNRLKRRALKRELPIKPKLHLGKRPKSKHSLAEQFFIEFDEPDNKPSLYIRRLAGEDWLNDYINMDKQFKISSIYFNQYNLILSKSHNSDRSLLDEIEISEPTHYLASGKSLSSYVNTLLGQLACAPTGAFKAGKGKSTHGVLRHSWPNLLSNRNSAFVFEQYFPTPGKLNYLSYQQMNNLLNPTSHKIYTPPVMPTAPNKFLLHIEKLIDAKHGTRLSPESIEYIAHPDRFKKRQVANLRWKQRAEAFWSAHNDYMDATGQPRQYHGPNGLSADHKLPVPPEFPHRFSSMELNIDRHKAKSKFFSDFPKWAVQIPIDAIEKLKYLYSEGIQIDHYRQPEQTPTACVPVA